MLGKVIVAVFFIALVSGQLAQGKYPNTIKCYSCDSPLTCHLPKIQICDQKSAENTQDQLLKYFPNISKVVNKEFQCLSMSYMYQNETVMSVGGCFNSDMNTCSLNPLNGSWILKECRSCSTNLCTLPTGINGTFSPTNMTGTSNNSIASLPTVHHSSHSSSTSILSYSTFIIGVVLVNMLVK